MRLRTLTCTLALASLTSTTAFASGEPPTDASFFQARVVGVLPVLTTGSRAAAYQRLAALIARGEHHNGVLSPTHFVSLDATQGFGFAGASTDLDLQIFRLAYLIGSAPSVSDDAAELAKLMKSYAAGRDAFARGAGQGRLDATALSNAMKLAEDGIAKGPARAHGYFAAGLWLGLSMLSVGLSEPDQTFVSMASPLATLLEEDAEFGGSDRAIAAELRKVATLLASGQVDLTAYKRALTSAFAVKSDGAK